MKTTRTKGILKSLDVTSYLCFRHGRHTHTHTYTHIIIIFRKHRGKSMKKHNQNVENIKINIQHRYSEQLLLFYCIWWFDRFHTHIHTHSHTLAEMYKKKRPTVIINAHNILLYSPSMTHFFTSHETSTKSLIFAFSFKHTAFLKTSECQKCILTFFTLRFSSREVSVLSTSSFHFPSSRVCSLYIEISFIKYNKKYEK